MVRWSKSTQAAWAAKSGPCVTVFQSPAAVQEAEDREAAAYRAERKRSGGRCEDAPCCGCCGPQAWGWYSEEY